MKKSPLFAALSAALAQAAHAGPPFVTDDPEPTDYHKWEIYNFIGGEHETGFNAYDAGIDLNYGGLRDVQLTSTLPLHKETGAPLDVGDVQLAVKWKFVHQKLGTLSADIAIFPRVFVPTGRRSTRAQVLLPVWAQRDFGKWSVFGGGGYTFNAGPSNRNYWVQGITVTRRIRPGFQIGVEEFHQGPTTIDDSPLTGLNLGALIHLQGPFSLIGSFGQGLNRRKTVFYSALKLDF